MTLLFFHLLSSLPLFSLPLPSLPFSKPNHIDNGIQPACCSVRQSRQKKKKTRKKFLRLNLSETQRAFLYLNNIDRAKQNIVKMTISCSHNALRDNHVTFMQYPRDRSAKNQKIEKKRKNMFFLSFLHVSN
jgi:hypothetical protein